MSPSPARPLVQGFFDPATSTVSYILSGPEGGEAAIIDPVLDYDPATGRISIGRADALLTALASNGLKLRWILETHAHADHLSAARYLTAVTGAPVVIGAGITRVQEVFAPRFGLEDLAPGGADFDLLVRDGDTLPLGAFSIRVMHTPGHTPACVTYLAGDAAFVGDTLFMPDYGTARTDFPGGDAGELYRSIRRILALPPETRLFTGHDYAPASRAAAWESTVAQQRAENIHIRDGITGQEFIAMRQARDAGLAPPRLILPSLQVNIRAGALPAPDAAGRRFLKIPLGLPAGFPG